MLLMPMRPPWEMTPTDEAWEGEAGGINPGHYNAYGKTATEKCPQCGRKWQRPCRRDQWGYWYMEGRMTGTGHLVLLCGPECARAYALRRKREAVEELKATRYYRIWEMRYRQGKTPRQIAAELGISQCAVINASLWVEDLHWLQLQWMEELERSGGNGRQADEVQHG